MNKKIMVFETSVGDGGHHLEYLHHLYLKALQKVDIEFVFVVPEKFKLTSQRFDWPIADNIKFEYLSDESVDAIRRMGGVKASYRLSKICAKAARENMVNEIFLISLVNYLLFLPILLPKGIKISGIIYNIYFYSWKSLSNKQKLEQALLYIIMSKSSKIGRVFLLNDSSAVKYANKLYKTTKFSYISDPIVKLGSNNTIDIRKKYGISENVKVFLQCGMMTRRKSTLKILDVIANLTDDNTVYFVFAGKVHGEIHDEFYKKAESLKGSHNIIVKDDHLTYEEMNAFIEASNYIFLLYDNISQSSGFLGHAAIHSKPVIANGNGLIGKLVRRYRLGFLADNLTHESIIIAVRNALKYNFSMPEDYARSHRVDDFIAPVFE